MSKQHDKLSKLEQIQFPPNILNVWTHNSINRTVWAYYFLLDPE